MLHCSPGASIDVLILELVRQDGRDKELVGIAQASVADCPEAIS
jgi:hypothetical protein